MRKFLMISSLALGAAAAVATPAQARGTYGEWGTELRFVAETEIPAGTAGGQNMSVCHLVDYLHFFFVPVYSITKDYALSNDGCTGQRYSVLSAADLSTMQAEGLVDASLPADPKPTLKDLVWGHAWLFVAGVVALFQFAYWLRWRPGRGRKRAAKPDTLAIHSLVAMSQVAVADGHIDQNEIRQISSILTRLTGKSYSMEHVADLLSRLNPSAKDLAQVGQDLSENDRRIILEAALNIAVADGEIHPNEYAVVSDLAQRMMIGPEQFRSTLARIAKHINATP